MAIGIPDELYQACTPPELAALIKAFQEVEDARRHEARQNAGLIASATYNVYRKKGMRAMQPLDFWKKRAPETQKLLPPEALAGALDDFTTAHNRSIRREA